MHTDTTTKDCSISLHFKDGKDGGSFLTLNFRELPLKKLIYLGSCFREVSPACGSWLMAMHTLEDLINRQFRNNQSFIELSNSTTEPELIVRCTSTGAKPVQDSILELLEEIGVTVKIVDTDADS